MDSKLSASSYEADAAALAGAGTSAEPEASSDYDTPKDPDAPSSFVADPEGVPVSVRSSSNWEAVTTPDATFFWCGSGSTCSTGRGGSAWGHILRVTLIIRANDHAGRWGDRLRSPACRFDLAWVP